MALSKKQSATTKKVSKPVKSDVVLTESKQKETLFLRTLLRPHVTEKAHVAIMLNKYAFRVTPEADKGAVRRAVEASYGVHVEDVNIINIPKKGRIFRGRRGAKSGYKKAIVTVREGETIEVFRGA